MAEKTEEPTPKRLRDAKRDGNIAFSQDLPAAASFLGGMVLIVFWAPRIAAEFKRLFEAAVAAIPAVNGTRTDFLWQEPFRQASLGWLTATLPVLVVLTLAGVIAAMVQAGVTFTPKKLAPSFDKLNPAQGLKKIFSAKGAIELLKTAFKLAVVITIGYGAVAGAIEWILPLHRVELGAFYAILAKVARSFAFQVAFAFAVIAGFDYFLQWKQWKKGLMMSRDEVKREYKEQEGDPMVKSQRKALHQELANQQIVREVRLADAVVVNPTHLAVAVRYEKDGMAAPRVTAKGGGALAKEMLKVARRHDIPIVRDVPLAHALFAVEMGRYVPQDLYEAVAEVLLFARQLREQGLGGTAMDRA
jgi:flagellar biosynthesis protein FlhB